jgi:biotin carboxyl carrier protein
VSIKEGDQVKEGTPLLMIEAMKMEFAIKAGASGVVKKIHVTEGMQLAPGQNLLDFEEQK